MYGLHKRNLKGIDWQKQGNFYMYLVKITYLYVGIILINLYNIFMMSYNNHLERVKNEWV